MQFPVCSCTNIDAKDFNGLLLLLFTALANIERRFQIETIVCTFLGEELRCSSFRSSVRQCPNTSCISINLDAVCACF